MSGAGLVAFAAIMLLNLMNQSFIDGAERAGYLMVPCACLVIGIWLLATSGRQTKR